MPDLTLEQAARDALAHSVTSPQSIAKRKPGRPKGSKTRTFPGHKIKDCRGLKYGSWTAIEPCRKYLPCGRARTSWLCRCDCGTEKEVLLASLTRGSSTGCGCNVSDKMKKALYKFSRASKNPPEGVHPVYYTVIKNNARRREKEFSISMNYIEILLFEQKHLCALSGVPIFFGRNHYGKESNACLDRIDSSMGYVEGNVQWLHKDVNKMKQEFCQLYFMEICRLVVERADLGKCAGIELMRRAAHA